MNKDRIEGSLKQLAGKARQKWARLTDDDIERIAGNEQELEGVIQERYGKTREEARREIEEWRRSQ